MTSPLPFVNSRNYLSTLLVSLLLLGAGRNATAQSFTWTGAGGDAIWSDSSNWISGGVNAAPPVTGTPGADLDFTTNVQATNTADTAFTLDSINFDSNAGAFDLTGGALTFNGTVQQATIANESASAQEIDNNLIFTGSNSISLATGITSGNASDPLTLGSAGGGGTLSLSGTLNEVVYGALTGNPELKINDTISGSGLLNIRTDKYITVISGTNTGFNGSISLEGDVIATNSNALGTASINDNTTAASQVIAAPTGTSVVFANSVTLGDTTGTNTALTFGLSGVTGASGTVYTDLGMVTMSGALTMVSGDPLKIVNVVTSATAALTGTLTAQSGTSVLQVGGLNGASAGTLILSETTSGFSGGVTMPSKLTLVIGNNAALGTGTFTIGGTNVSTSTISPNIGATNGPITVANSVLMSGSVGVTQNTTFGVVGFSSPLTFTGTTTLGVSENLVAGAGQVTTFQGPIVQQSGTIANLAFKGSSTGGSTGGTFVLAGSNSYTGINTLSPGSGLYATVQVTNPYGLGLNTSGSAINLAASIPSGVGTLSLLNDGTGNNGTIIYGPGNGYNVTVSSTGGNIINVDHASTATGNTIQLGTLTMTQGGAVLTVTGSDGYGLDFSGNGSFNSTYYLNNSVPLTISGTTFLSNGAVRTLYLEGSSTTNLVGPIIASNGGNEDIYISAGKVIFSGTTNLTGTAITTINGGDLAGNNAANALGTGLLVINSGTLEAEQSFTLATSTTLGSVNSTIKVDAGSNLALSKALAGTGVLNLTGPGTLTLTVANSYSGGTTITSGTLSAIADNNFGLSTTGIKLNGGALLASATFSTARVVTVAAGSIIDTSTNTFTLTGGLAGSASLTKAGLGVMSISDGSTASTFNGALTVNAGRVELNNTAGTNALASGASITINSGGEVRLIQSNQINGNANVSLAGGLFNSNANSDTLGTLTLASGSSSLSFGSSGSSVLTFADSSALAWSGTLTIQNWNGLIGGGGTDQLYIGTSNTLTMAQLQDMAFINPAGLSAGTYGAAQLSDGEIVALIPEPGTWLMMLSGMGVLGMMRRFRRRV